MKKLLIMLCMFCLCLPCFAEDIVEWSSIAPSEYINAEYIENDTFVNKHLLASTLSIFTIVGIPFVIKSSIKSNDINTNNYWYERRKNFEKEKAICMQIKDKDKQIESLIKLRQNEIQKNINRQYHNEEMYSIRF